MDESMAALLQGMPSPEETAQMLAKFQGQQAPPQQPALPDWMQGMPSPEETAQHLAKLGITPDATMQQVGTQETAQQQQQRLAQEYQNHQFAFAENAPYALTNPVFRGMARAGDTMAQTAAIPLNFATGLDVSGQIGQHTDDQEAIYQKKHGHETPFGERLVSGVVQGVSEIVGIGGAIGPTGYMATMGTKAYDDGLKEAADSGISGAQKHAYAGVNAAAEVLTEFLFFKSGKGALAKVQGVSAPIKRGLWELFKTGGEEAVEEGVNQAIQNANQMAHGMKPWDVSALMDGVGEAMAIGGATGAAVSAPGAIRQQMQQRRLTPQNPQGVQQPPVQPPQAQPVETPVPAVEPPTNPAPVAQEPPNAPMPQPQQPNPVPVAPPIGPEAQAPNETEVPPASEQPVEAPRKLTAEEKRGLRDLGLNNAQINKLTPEEVRQALTQQPTQVEQPAVPHEPPAGEKPVVVPQTGNVELGNKNALNVHETISDTLRAPPESARALPHDNISRAVAKGAVVVGQNGHQFTLQQGPGKEVPTFQGQERQFTLADGSTIPENLIHAVLDHQGNMLWSRPMQGEAPKLAEQKPAPAKITGQRPQNATPMLQERNTDVTNIGPKNAEPFIKADVDAAQKLGIAKDIQTLSAVRVPHVLSHYDIAARLHNQGIAKDVSHSDLSRIVAAVRGDVGEWVRQEANAPVNSERTNERTVTPQNPRKSIEQEAISAEKPFALETKPKPEAKRPTVENVTGKQKSLLEGTENDLPGQKYLVPDVGRTVEPEKLPEPHKERRQAAAEKGRATASERDAELHLHRTAREFDVPFDHLRDAVHREIEKDREHWDALKEAAGKPLTPGERKKFQEGDEMSLPKKRLDELADSLHSETGSRRNSGLNFEEVFDAIKNGMPPEPSFSNEEYVRKVARTMETPAETGDTSFNPDDLSFYKPKRGQKVPELQKKTGKSTRINEHDIRKTLEKDFDVPVFRGRTKGAKGFYKWADDVIRLSSDAWASMTVLSHEIGHAFDAKQDFVNNVPPNANIELQGLDYEPDRADAREGFSEFVRHYLTLDDAAMIAPSTFAHFQTWLNANPQEKSKFDRAKRLIDALREQNPMDAVLSQQLRNGTQNLAQETTAWDKVKAAFERISDGYMAQLHDETHMVKKIGAKAADKLGRTRERFDALMNRLWRSDSIHAQVALADAGVHTISGTPEKLSESLKHYLRDIKRDELDELQGFIRAKVALANIERKPGYNPGQPQQVYEELIEGIEADPDKAARFDEAAKGVREYLGALVKLQAHEGVISEGDAKRILDSMPEYYAPVHRIREYGVVNRVKGFLNGSRKGFLDAKGEPRRLGQGSSDAMLDLWDSIIKQNAAAHNAAVKYAMIVPFLRLTLPRLGGAKGLGDQITEVDPKSVMDHVKLGNLLNELASEKKVGSEIRQPLLTEDEVQLIKDVDDLRHARIGKAMLARLKAQYGTDDVNDLKEHTGDVWGLADSVAFWRKDFGSSEKEHIVRVNVNGEPVLVQFRDYNTWKAMTGMRNAVEAGVFSQMYSAIAEGMRTYVTNPVKALTVGLNPTTIPKLAVIDYPGFLLHSNHTGAIERFYAPLQGIGRLVGAMLYHKLHGKFPKWVQDQATIGKIAEELQQQDAGRVSSQRFFSGGSVSNKGIRETFLPVPEKEGIGQTILRNWPNFLESWRETLGTLDAGMRIPEMLGYLRSHGFTPNKNVSPSDLEAGKNRWLDPSGNMIDDLPADMKSGALAANNEVLVNFKRKGSAAREADKLIPFFSAAIAGAEKELRTMGAMAKGVGRAAIGKPHQVENFGPKLAGWAGIATASALYWWFNHDDDDREGMDPEIANRYWTFSSNGIPYAKIAKPRGYGIVINSIEGMLDWLVDGKKPHFGEKLGTELDELRPVKSNNPLNWPAGINVGYQLAVNKDWSGRPIENQFDVEKGIQTQYRSQPWTLETSKVLSKFLTQWIGGSPAKTEYFLNQMTGSMYGDLAGVSENAARGEFEPRTSPITRPFATRSLYQRSTGDFYDQYRAIESNVNTAKHEGWDTPETQAEAEKFRQLDRYKDVMSAIRKSASDVKDYEKKLTLDSYSVGMSDYALGKPERKSFPNPLKNTDKDVPKEVAEERNKFILSLAHAMSSNPNPRGVHTKEQAEAFPERVAESKIRRDWAAAELKRLGYAPQDVAKIVVQENARNGRKVTSHSLGEMVGAMAQAK